MTSMVEPDDGPEGLRAAAILDDGRCDADALLAGVVAELRRSGRRVRGLQMTYPLGRGSCASPMVLVDIDSGDEYRVSQELGSGSTSCRADPQGFAGASGVFRRALDERPDLVVSNRFGGLEVQGGGFRAELLALMAQDLPVLTIVSSPHVPAWLEFTGGAPLLDPEPDAVRRWLDATLAPGAADAAAR